MTIPTCSGYHFPRDVIQRAVWMYLRFTLSYRDVEDLLAERGIEVSYESVRRWVLTFGPASQRVLPAQVVPEVDRHRQGDDRRIGGEFTQQAVGWWAGRAALAREQLDHGRACAAIAGVIAKVAPESTQARRT